MQHGLVAHGDVRADLHGTAFIHVQHAASWMLVPRRIRMASLSPRMETCDQMLTPASSVTLPMMSALSAT